MAYTPSGTIAFYRVPWKSDYKDVRLFTSKTEESNYFSSPLRVEQNYTYIRDKQAIKVNANKEAMEQYNYIRYMNENFSLKWFYAFITGVEYINQNACYIYFEQDVYTTWWDCFSIKSAFVEREHANAEWVGVNTTSEQFIISNYEQNKVVYSRDYTPDFDEETSASIASIIVIATSVPYIEMLSKDTYLQNNKPESDDLKFYNVQYTTPKAQTALLMGIPTEYTYLRFYSRTKFDYFIEVMNLTGQVDSIVSAFVMNTAIADSIFTSSLPTGDIGKIQFRYQRLAQSTNKPVTVDYSTKSYIESIIHSANETFEEKESTVLDLEGYEPKNEKMFHYPFCKWVLDANNGDFVELHPELLPSPRSLTIKEKMSVDIDAKCKAVPQHYALSPTIAADSGSNLYPINASVEMSASSNLPFVKDNAAIWAALNANTTRTQLNNAKWKLVSDIILGSIDVAASAVGGGASLALGGHAPNAVSYGKQAVSELTDTIRAGTRDIMQLREIEANIDDKSNLPSSPANMSYNDTWQSQNGMLKFAIRHMCPPLSDVKKYDKFLSKYGYRTCDFKIPNITSRTNWNYVKTTEITIAPVARNSYAPTDTELRFIEDIFNKGVTFWHINDVGNYGDYTNEIVGDTNGK